MLWTYLNVFRIAIWWNRPRSSINLDRWSCNTFCRRTNVEFKPVSLRRTDFRLHIDATVRRIDCRQNDVSTMSIWPTWTSDLTSFYSLGSEVGRFWRNGLSPTSDAPTLKRQVAWILEKQRLPVKVLRPTLEKLRNICAYWCQSRWKGWVCCCSTCNSQKWNWWRSCLKSRPPAL